MLAPVAPLQPFLSCSCCLPCSGLSRRFVAESCVGACGSFAAFLSLQGGRGSSFFGREGMRMQELYDALRAEFEGGGPPDIETVRGLLGSGANPNNELARNQFCQQVPLHYAAQDNHLEAAEVLLNEGGADPNLRTDARNTALHLAAEQGHEHMTALLLRNKADVTATTLAYWTALHWAACRGRRKVVELLLQTGAPVDAVTNLAETPLHLACANGHEETAVRLLNAGAGLKARTSGGMLPYDLATRGGHTSLAKTLYELQGSDWKPGMAVPRAGGRDGALSPERMGRLSPTRDRFGSGHLSPERAGHGSPAPMVHGGKSFSTPGWTPTPGEAAMEAKVAEAEAALERRDPSTAFLACHAMLDETRLSGILRKRLHSVLLSSGQFMIEQRAAGKWNEALLITKMESDLAAAEDSKADLENEVHAKEEEIMELQAKLKLIGSGPDEATRQKILRLENDLSATKQELDQSTANAADAAREAESAAAGAAKENADLAAKLQAADTNVVASAAEVEKLKETITQQAGEIVAFNQKLERAKSRMKERSEFFWTKSGNGAIKKQLKEMGDDASRWTKPQQLDRVVASDLALLGDDE